MMNENFNNNEASVMDDNAVEEIFENALMELNENDDAAVAEVTEETIDDGSSALGKVVYVIGGAAIAGGIAYGAKKVFDWAKNKRQDKKLEKEDPDAYWELMQQRAIDDINKKREKATSKKGFKLFGKKQQESTVEQPAEAAIEEPAAEETISVEEEVVKKTTNKKKATK